MATFKSSFDVFDIIDPGMNERILLTLRKHLLEEQEENAVSKVYRNKITDCRDKNLAFLEDIALDELYEADYHLKLKGDALGLMLEFLQGDDGEIEVTLNMCSNHFNLFNEIVAFMLIEVYEEYDPCDTDLEKVEKFLLYNLDCKSLIIEQVENQLMSDINNSDLTAISELLENIDHKKLQNYLARD